MKLIQSFATENLPDVMQTVIKSANLQLQQFAQGADFSDKMVQAF